MTTLWPTDLTVDGLLFHPFISGRRHPADPELEMAAVAGYPQPPVLVDKPLLVERLPVPTRPTRPTQPRRGRRRRCGSGSQTRSAPSEVAVPEQGIFLSRSRWHAQHRRASGTMHKRAFANEAEADELFAKRGLRVVHPQLPYPDAGRDTADDGHQLSGEGVGRSRCLIRLPAPAPGPTGGLVGVGACAVPPTPAAVVAPTS